MSYNAIELVSILILDVVDKLSLHVRWDVPTLADEMLSQFSRIPGHRCREPSATEATLEHFVAIRVLLCLVVLPDNTLGFRTSRATLRRLRHLFSGCGSDPSLQPLVSNHSSIVVFIQTLNVNTNKTSLSIPVHK